MKRLALIFGIVSAAVGAVVSLIDVAMLTSESYPFSFGFGMAWGAPSLLLGRALGIKEGTNALLWDSLEIVVNTVLCFLTGALIGLAAYLVTRCFPKSEKTHRDETQAG